LETTEGAAGVAVIRHTVVEKHVVLQVPDVMETEISMILDEVVGEVVVAEVDRMVEDMKNGMIGDTMTAEEEVVQMEAEGETEVEVEHLLGGDEVRVPGKVLQREGLRSSNGIVNARSAKQLKLPQLDLHIEGTLQHMITNRSTLFLVKLIYSQQVQANRGVLLIEHQTNRK
jgi:hypothetical protein